MKRWVVLLLVACACPAKPSTNGGGGGGSSGSGGSAGPTVPVAPAGTATTCAEARAKVETMYRAEAQQKEPKRVDEAVSDNTTMVMTDCNKAPDRFVPCINKASTVAELEKQCLIPLDDEGTEGERK